MTTSNAVPELKDKFPKLAQSGSAPQVPKIAVTGELTGDTEDLGLMHAPDPVGHFMLVALPNVELMTKGGIHIPATTTDNERAASVVGTVLAMGPDCYLDPPPKLPENLPAGAPVTVLAARPRFPTGPWCKVGDTVLFSRYAGKRFRIEGVEFRMLADDEIVSTVPIGAKVGGL